MSSPEVGLGGSILTTAQPIRKKPISQGANFFMLNQQPDVCRNSRDAYRTAPAGEILGDIGAGVPIVPELLKPNAK